MGLCGWIVFGFFAGLIGRALMPGTQKLGFILTTLLGVAGAFVGGLIAGIIRGGDWMTLRPSGFIGAVLGSVVILVVAGILNRRR